MVGFRLLPFRTNRGIRHTHLAVGQNQWYHFGKGAPPILVYFSGDWDVHWGYGLFTHGHLCVTEMSHIFGWTGALLWEISPKQHGCLGSLKGFGNEPEGGPHGNHQLDFINNGFALEDRGEPIPTADWQQDTPVCERIDRFETLASFFQPLGTSGWAQGPGLLTPLGRSFALDFLLKGTRTN